MHKLLVLVGVVLLAAMSGCAPGHTTEQAYNRLDFRQVVREAKAKVFPAVLFVKVIRESHEEGKRDAQEVVGSGVIISPDGDALTNWHVVDKAVEVRCLLTDGRGIAAEVLGSDKTTDLALIRLKLTDEDKPLPYATFADSDKLTEGDFVMAMGAPWGLNRSVSIGIVSCNRRFLPENSEYSLWIQTDAAISPGNSGGPLVDTNGHVAGVNTRGIMYGGDMGFAVPSNTVVSVLDQLRRHGRINWSWLGLKLQPLRDFNRNIYFEGERGVIVADTDPGSPARRAGIEPRDRILALNGEPVNALTEEDLPHVRRQLAGLPKGAEVACLLERDGTPINLTLVPREKGAVEGEELDCPRWDMTVKEINQFDNPDLSFYRDKGVFVFGVKYEGNASNAQLRPQDILLRIGSRKITTLQDVKEAHAEALKNIDRQHRLLVVVLRNGLTRQLVLDFSRNYEKE